jgi:DNA-directed RNA polymerase subunit RPC12/RpoP
MVLMDAVKMEFKCKLCGRNLITLQSIERGYGIKCYNKILEKRQTKLDIFLEDDKK